MNNLANKILRKCSFIYQRLNNTLVFLDQGIVSFGNFLVSITILRFLGIEIFGIFSFFWLILLLINNIQISYIISPMLTNAPKQSISNIGYFYGSIFIQQLIFTLIIFLFTFFILKFLGNYVLAFQFERFHLSFSLLIVVTQFHQFFRRLLFSKKFYYKNLIIDFITYFVLIFLIIYLNFLNKLNLESVLWSFVCAFISGILINIPIIFSLNYKFKNTYKSIVENWIIAKWLLLTSLLQWFSGNLWIMNAGLILGPYTLGIIRACQTLLNISNIIFQSIENFIPGTVSKKYISGGVKEMQLYLKEFTKKFFMMILIIILVVIFFSKILLNTVYGTETGSYYQLLIFLALIIPIHLLQYPPTYGLRALGKTKPIFISYLFSCIFTLLVSKFTITYFKVPGLIFGLYSTQLIIIFILYFKYYQILKKKKK